MVDDRDTPRHPIRVVATRTGLNPAILRMWERRYRVVEPPRSEGGQRLYSDADVERLTLLHRATQAGRSIGHAAALSTAELAALVAEDDAGRRRAAEAAGPESGHASLESAWASAQSFAPERLAAVLRSALFQLGSARFIDDVVAPLLDRVGQAWVDGALSPAHEHAVSAVVRRVLDELAGGLDMPADAPAIVVATPAGDRHEFGALLAAATAAGAGWRVVYLGCDLPGAEIARAAAQAGAGLVALSVVYAKNLPRAVGEIATLHDQLGGRARIVLGGRAADSLVRLLPPGSAEPIADLAALRALLAAGAATR